MPTKDETLAGQAVYSPRTLRWYDTLVLGLSNRWIWRCPTSRLLDWYNEFVSDNHLDVGVGTGFFLDHCRFPTTAPRITLVDLNGNCLGVTAARIARYHPTPILADVLQPLQLPAGPYSSIGVNYLLHCLPGTLATKACVFDHLLPYLASDGVLFGSTLLGDGVPRNWIARRLAAFYNRQRIFSNQHDRLDDLRQQLEARFEQVRIEVIGCAALFTATGKRA